jgi:hypothetical protein
MKLVKNAKVKPPQLKRGVKSIFVRALGKAAEQNWDRVIIIGQGKEKGSWQHTPMEDAIVIGMLELSKKYILDDEY